MNSETLSIKYPFKARESVFNLFVPKGECTMEPPDIRLLFFIYTNGTIQIYEWYTCPPLAGMILIIRITQIHSYYSYNTYTFVYLYNSYLFYYIIKR